MAAAYLMGSSQGSAFFCSKVTFPSRPEAYGAQRLEHGRLRPGETGNVQMWGVSPVPHRPFAVKIVAVIRIVYCLSCGKHLGGVDTKEDILLDCPKCKTKNVCFAHEVATK